MAKKRTRLEIIRDILEVVRNRSGKVKPTHILYKSNLSSSMMDKYLGELIQKGFINEEKLKRGKSYSITHKGLEFLSQYNAILDFTDTFGLGN